MSRLRTNFVGGYLEDDPLSLTATTATSQAFSTLPAISAGADHLAIVLDPEDEPEIVWVTEHVAMSTTVTILREQEGTTAREHHNDTYWVHAPTSQDWSYFDQEKAEVQAYIDEADARLDQAVLDVKEVVNETALIVSPSAHSLSDDFTTNTLTDYTQVKVNDPSKSEWRWGRGVISGKINAFATSNGPSVALMKPLDGMTYPITLETSMRSFAPRAVNYFMFGILFSNSLATTGSEQIWTRHYYNTGVAGSGDYTMGLNVNGNYQTDIASSQGNWATGSSYRYIRLIWVTVNVFECWASPDSINWIRIGNLTRAVTPTHFGMAMSTWSTAQSGIVTFEYLRVYNADLQDQPSP